MVWYETGTASKWKFTTYERDSESGLDYAMFRYHSSRVGRFSSPDPRAGSASAPQSLNRYAYVQNDPVNFMDPLGLCTSNTYLPDSVITICNVTATNPGGGVAFGGWSGSPGGGSPGIGGGGMLGGFGRGGVDNRFWLLVPEYEAWRDGELVAANNVSDPNAQDPTKLPLCLAVFAKSSLDALNPFSPSLGSAGEPLAAFFSRQQFNAALQYAASRPNVLGGTGLLYPFKSSVFRAKLAASQATAAAGPLITLDLALFQGLIVETNAARKGECRAF